MKAYKTAWIISLLVITCVVAISVICNFVGIDLPDMLVRVFGILDLVAIVVLIFTTVKLKLWKSNK